MCPPKTKQKTLQISHLYGYIVNMMHEVCAVQIPLMLLGAVLLKIYTLT